MLHYGAGMTVAVSGQTLLLRDAMGRYLAAQIPNCHATFFPDDGHLLFDHMSEIVRAFAI
jgi:hypothetical protein